MIKVRLCKGIIFFAFAGLAGCATAVDSTEKVDEDHAAIRNGNTVTGAPYESLFVKVSIAGSGCSGTLLGDSHTLLAKWVLTAGHCFGSVLNQTTRVVDPTNVSVSRDGGTWTAKNVFLHPESIAATGDSSTTEDIDVALIELNTWMAVSGTAYFSTGTPTALQGQSVRCAGYGLSGWTDTNGDGVYSGSEGTGFGTLRWGDFTISADTVPAAFYRLSVPNAAGQGLMSGDSGSSCFYVPPANANGFTITGVHKAGGTNSVGVPNYNRETAAVRFSTWVRTFVPRT